MEKDLVWYVNDYDIKEDRYIFTNEEGNEISIGICYTYLEEIS